MGKSLLLLWLLLGQQIAFAVTTADSRLHVLIDPGHGGIDGGAIQGKAREADIALRVGLAIQELLAQDTNFHVSMTRKVDRYLSLHERIEIAEKAKAEVFLSIHANSSVDQRVRGVEIYFQNHLPPDEETLFLASNENKFARKQSDAVLQLREVEPTKRNDILAILDDLKRQNRMVASYELSRKMLQVWNAGQSNVNTSALRQAPFFVVSNANMPSILVELGFLTNQQEANRLMSPRYQKEIARKIYKGLLAFRHSQTISTEKMAELKMIPSMMPRNQ